jgi:hypothetical protein
MEILTAPSVLNTIQSKTSIKSLAIFAEIFSAVSQNKPSNAIDTYEKASASDQFAIMRPQTTENGTTQGTNYKENGVRFQGRKDTLSMGKKVSLYSCTIVVNFVGFRVSNIALK